MTESEILRKNNESPIMAEFDEGVFGILIGITFITPESGGKNLNNFCDDGIFTGKYKFCGGNIIRLHQLTKNETMAASYKFWASKDSLTYFDVIWDVDTYEFTMDEIASKLGIPVEKLKIKK